MRLSSSRQMRDLSSGDAAKPRTTRSRKIADSIGLIVAAFLFGTAFVGFFGIPPYAPLQISARVSHLAPGMTEPEVWRILGYKLHLEVGSGPSEDFRAGYSLPFGCGLGMIWNRTTKPARLKCGAWRTPFSRMTFGLPHS